MTESITLTLTREEAFALYELSDLGLERFVREPKLRQKYERLDWNMEVACTASDKLGQAAYGEMRPPPWKELFSWKRKQAS